MEITKIDPRISELGKTRVTPRIDMPGKDQDYSLDQ